MKHTFRALTVCLIITLLLPATLDAARAPHLPADATTTVALWSTPIPIASGLTDATRPVLAQTADGATHALWESGGNVFYAAQLPGMGWSQGERIASGIEPSLAIDGAGQLHAVFANQFLGNYDIFHSVYQAGAWTLPINVTRTSGVSMKPVLATGNNGQVHVAWMDNSPGYWTIYTAVWSGGFWSSQPIPNGRGQAPAIAVTQDAKVFLAWQDRVPTLDNPSGVFNILLSQWQGGSWSVPINVSDRTDLDAIGVSLATTADGLAHLVWIEGLQTVRYDFGAGAYWPNPQTVVHATVMARGPRIAVAPGDVLHIAWDEGEVLRITSAAKAPPSWPKPEVVTALQGTLKDVGLTVGGRPGANLTLSWVQTAAPGNVNIYQSYRERQPNRRIWLPLTRTD